MSERSHKLVQQWLQQSAIGDDDLQQLVAENPYFSAAQLLLLKRLDVTSDTYAAQRTKAALHVYNPIQLAETKTFDFPFEPVDALPEMPATEPIAAEPISLEEKEADTFKEINEAPTVIEQEFIKAEPTTSHPPEPEITTPDQKEKERVDHSLETEKSEALLAAETNAGEPITEEADQDNSIQEPKLKLPAFDLSAPVTAADGGITFEPFHTVDYFASQGIKLSQTEAGNDRFGKQVKSFTEWLKTMKKLPTTALTQNTDGVGESKVASLAVHSIQNADIVTEAMAEVWVKQGNIQKASEVYNKLSLQNPSKKAYFAAKIESLKKPS